MIDGGNQFEETNQTVTDQSTAVNNAVAVQAVTAATGTVSNPTPVKKESYGSRVKKMNNKQLLSELRRKCSDERGYRINQIFAVALTTIFESHVRKNAKNNSGRR